MSSMVRTCNEIMLPHVDNRTDKIPRRIRGAKSGNIYIPQPFDFIVHLLYNDKPIYLPLPVASYFSGVELAKHKKVNPCYGISPKYVAKDEPTLSR